MNFRVIQGDALSVLRTLPEASVQMCVTSPPYWGLRDYGIRVLRNDGTLWLNLGDSYATGAGKASIPGGGSQGENWQSFRPRVT